MYMLKDACLEEISRNFYHTDIGVNSLLTVKVSSQVKMKLRTEIWKKHIIIAAFIVSLQSCPDYP